MDKETLLEWYRQMVLIRRFEQRCAELYQLGKIGGFLHLYIGQEAVAVGSIGARQEGDHVITAYRDHGHALAVGSDPEPADGRTDGQGDRRQQRPRRLHASGRCRSQLLGRLRRRRRAFAAGCRHRPG